MARWVLNFASFKKPNDIFDTVKSGAKTIETRPYNPKAKRNYSKVAEGDTLIFKSRDTGEKIERIATFVHLYNSIKKMSESEQVDSIMPGINTPGELVEFFEEIKRKFGSSYAKKIEGYGIVAIGFK